MGFIDEKYPELIPTYNVPQSIEILPDEVDKFEHNTLFNDIYAEYYNQLAEDTGDDQYKKNAERMLNCHKFWYGDHYKLQQVFDVKHITLCHDRYCVNCQHLKQAAMLQRFTKISEDTLKDHDLYLMTLTVPNCPIDRLKTALDNFAHAFRNIIRYFTGNSVVAGIDFKSYGFHACYRNIEIVINPNSFHPHYHCILALKKGLDESKLFTNDYSYSYGKLSRKFSAFEILIQKLLAIGYNNIRLDKIVVDYVLNKKDVDQAKLESWCKKHNTDIELLKAIRKQGYSCVIDKIEGDLWHEAFKYATKLTKDGAALMSYYQFKALVPLLKHIHFGQGYGAWHKLPKDDWEIDENVLAAYEYVVHHLKDVEDPVEYSFKILELKQQLHDKSLRCITRKKAYKVIADWFAEKSPDDEPF